MNEMKLIDDLISATSENSVLAKDVRVGVSWTAVLGKYCGLAKTYGIHIQHSAYTRDLGRLTEKTTVQLAEYLKSWDMVEAGIGLASINSMILPKGKVGVNALDVIAEMGKDKRVTFIGKFPHIEQIHSSAKELFILELDESLVDSSSGVLPATAAEYVIPESDIVAITGSALINKSMEHILKLCTASNAYTIVLGPSTPMCDVLFDYGADMLAGVEVVNPDSLLKKISQSGGMLNPKIFREEIVFRLMER
jgi:uncharacterized protein (DUF4213/DUF364 family)